MCQVRRLIFSEPYQIRIQTGPAPAPGQGEVCVETYLSAISAGTEMLFYRGEVPDEMPVDTTIASMDQSVNYPLTYGYACVGTVANLGAGVDPAWMGRRVFAFHPHASHFIAEPAALHPIPDNLTWEQAAFLPNMETAVNLVMDTAPAIGESGIVFGQGIVGLLVVFLLGQFPLNALCAVDHYAKRRRLAHELGAHHVLTPDDLETHLLQDRHPGWLDCDFALEVSSNPAALNQAIQLTPFGGRIVIGSWYGNKSAALELGGEFHRKRIRLLSSQVSTVDGQWQNRWSKQRRLQTAWRMLARLPAERLVSHRIRVEDAPRAYQQLDQTPADTLQVLLTY